VVTLCDGWGPGDLIWMFEQFERLFQHPDRYALIVDTLSATNPPSALERKLLTDWDNANVANTERHNVGAAIVVGSSLIRNSLTALSWIVRRKNPVVYVSTMAQAADWCVERLRDAGIPLSIEARGYLFTRVSDSKP
jgi:hypothetical protein